MANFLKIYKLFPCIEKKLRYWYALNFPQEYSARIYKHYLGKNLDWNNPVDFNEKIQWLKFYSDTSMWSDLTDKYKVRKYVEECGLKNTLNELYAIFDKPEHIDISYLPDSFVLKANNRCGGVFVVGDKSTVTNDEIRTFFKKLMKYKYGVYSGEPHYFRIKSCIIAEKLLQNDNSSTSSSIIDYKIFCFKGKAKYIMVCVNRDLTLGHSKSDVLFYDLDWNPKYDCLTEDVSSIQLPRPSSLASMIAAAEVLSKPFPVVRVDFYEIDGKPIFGEMTFTSEAGMTKTYTEDFLKELGGYIELSNHKNAK